MKLNKGVSVFSFGLFMLAVLLLPLLAAEGMKIEMKVDGMV
jgi:hypothetical protein